MSDHVADRELGATEPMQAEGGGIGLVDDTWPDSAGTRIGFIYGRSAAILVFKDTDGYIQWDVKGDHLSPTQARVHYEFDTLRMRIRQCVAESKQELFKDRMAQALFHALGEPDESRALGYFKTIAIEVQSEAQRDARHRYLGYGSVAAVLVILISLGVAYFPATSDIRTVALSAAAGAAGAWASVLHRVWAMVLPANETPAHLMLQGATRIVLGALFSVAALAAIHASILIPAAASSPWSLGLAMFVAGWSERLVPEMMARIEGEMSRSPARSDG